MKKLYIKRGYMVHKYNIKNKGKVLRTEEILLMRSLAVKCWSRIKHENTN
jgi:hypothetical protein